MASHQRASYLSHWLSARIFAVQEIDGSFFQRNAFAAKVALVALLVFLLYWLWLLGWIYVAFYLLLLASHFVLFMSTKCEFCSYNDTCPGGQMRARCWELLQP